MITFHHGIFEELGNIQLLVNHLIKKSNCVIHRQPTCGITWNQAQLIGIRGSDSAHEAAL